MKERRKREEENGRFSGYDGFGINTKAAKRNKIQKVSSKLVAVSYQLIFVNLAAPYSFARIRIRFVIFPCLKMKRGENLFSSSRFLLFSS
jgi:hypothetical protein